jgi:hypothetical protein
MERTVEPENRYGYICTYYEWEFGYRNAYERGHSSIVTSSKRVSKTYVAFAMHIALKNIIHLKASQYVENGFMDREGSGPSYVTNDRDIDPEVLTLRHLSAGFIIICILWALSIVTFSIECAPKLRRIIKKQCEMCLMSYVVVKFMKMKKLL